MSAATQRILLYKLKESLNEVDELVQATPSAKASAEEWQQWKERLDGAEDKLKERSTSVSSRTMSEADQADVARINRSIDAARTKYEHVKWRSEDTKAQEPKAQEPEAEVESVVTDSKQNHVGDAEQSSTTDVEDGLDDDNLAESFSDISSSTSDQSTPAYEHPLSAVSGPTSLNGEKKLAEVITYEIPCEACRHDKVPCIREYVRRGRVRCDRCVTRGYRCSFPKAVDNESAVTITFDSREQRKRKAPLPDDELLEDSHYKRARPNSRAEAARPNSSKDHPPAPVSPSARQTNNSAMASFTASTSATRRSIHGASDDLSEEDEGSSHTALADLIAQERTRMKDEISQMADTLKENMLSIVDERFDRILQTLDAGSSS
ncbi:hypothetical protein PENSPDRAFT_756714 [Peniophora sp. CONT]|nr:hypothetical protein PENSPDRAFT_756714 [Peniophora sp. CONT]